MSIPQRVKALEWREGRLRLLDQTLLPRQEAYRDLADYREVVEAIRSLRVRGAPLLGVAGAYALLLAAVELAATPQEQFWQGLKKAAGEVSSARPTAVNLPRAVERCLRVAQEAKTPGEAVERLFSVAQSLEEEDREATYRMGEAGASLIPHGATLLTHCNTGALATAGIGTALGVVRVAWAQGKVREVFVTETRPLLQGARLTAWELLKEGVPTTLVVDSAVGGLLRAGRVTAILVGADRIARNGDLANKVGTYTLALLAQAHGVPFYVVAPTSTLDPSTPDGPSIPIERRSEGEVTSFGNTPTAPEGVGAWNPAFDVTPASLVSAIVTERGVFRPPYGEALWR